jgi:hypothetical protein
MLWGLIVAAAAIICGVVYIKAQLSVKRENSNATLPGNDFILIPIFSPESNIQITSVTSHFHIAVVGVISLLDFSMLIGLTVSIRACGIQTAFKAKSCDQIDTYAQSALILWHLNRRLNCSEAMYQPFDGF